MTTKKQLADYLSAMQTDDVLAATDRAKTQARTLLEDQCITYDEHYQDIADRIICLTAAEVLSKLTIDDMR